MKFEIPNCHGNKQNKLAWKAPQIPNIVQLLVTN